MLFSSLFLLNSHTVKPKVLGTHILKQPVVYAALPDADVVFEGSATMTDSRVTTLADFFASYHSPLAPFAANIVNKADSYGIDYRLVPAIAMQETTLCKKTLPSAKYNCWGFGVWGHTVTSFASYTEAIDTISKYFAKRKERGIDTLDAIGNIYNPGNTNHWKENVAYVMGQL